MGIFDKFKDLVGIDEYDDDDIFSDDDIGDEFDEDFDDEDDLV